MSEGGGQQLDTQSLATMVRSWVHFDNLAATFQRQAQQARSARFRWETQIMDYLKINRIPNAILQIAGGRLTMVEERHANPLTLGRLEELLHQYYGNKGSNTTDETAEVMKFIKTNRGATIEARLKKS